MKYNIILLLGLTVLISGCINMQPESDLGGGVEITNFETIPRSAEDVDEVSFLVEVQNTGSVTANCVRGDIYGLGGWRNLGGQYLPGYKRGTFWNLEKDEEGWSFDLEADQLLDTLGVTGWAQEEIRDLYQPIYDFVPDFAKDLLGMPDPEQISLDNFNFDIHWDEGEGIDFDLYWDVYSRMIACDPVTFHSLYTVWGNETFYPEKLETHEPGQLKNTEWVFIPPDLIKGFKEDFDVIFRLTYTYKTTGTINFPVISKQEEQRNGLPSTTFTKDESDSPVTLSIVSGDFPIITSYRDYELGGDQYQYHPLTFQLENIGNGFPVLPFVEDRERSNGIILGWIEARGPGVQFSECLGEKNTNKVTIDAESDFQKLQMVKLRSDGRSKFGCTLKVDRTAWKNRDKGTISIVYRFGYTYSTDKTVTVPVEGT